ncbi:MAG: UPF0280 family protein [bacterium]
MKTRLYIPRTYRTYCSSERFIQFGVIHKQSDLLILAKINLYDQAMSALTRLRQEIESYTIFDSEFLTALKPITILSSAPEIVKDMSLSAKKMDVGPMAAVAGAISEYVARSLSKFSDEVIVENGGDNFIINREPLTIGIYAGNSPLSMKIGIELEPHPEGIGIATSSGTVGHSLSFGNADAVTVLAKRGSLADAAATRICNMVKTEDDIPGAMVFVEKNVEILGAIIIIKNRVGVTDKALKLRRIEEGNDSRTNRLFCRD